jgi:membrane-bound ClpP family serine protease
MLFASTFFNSLFSADFVNALRCPLGSIGLLSILLGFIGIKFFSKESAIMKLIVYLLLAVGVVMLTVELGKPSSSLTKPGAYSAPNVQPNKSATPDTPTP